MSAGFVETTIQTTDLFSQATDHLAFIADCMDEQQGAPPPAAAEGMPSMDPKSIITHLLMKKVAMSLDHGSEAQQERTISEEKVE